eukprot:UN00808
MFLLEVRVYICSIPTQVIGNHLSLKESAESPFAVEWSQCKTSFSC